VYFEFVNIFGFIIQKLLAKCIEVSGSFFSRIFFQPCRRHGNVYKCKAIKYFVHTVRGKKIIFKKMNFFISFVSSLVFAGIPRQGIHIIHEPVSRHYHEVVAADIITDKRKWYWDI
jgi:hypothetical protein